MSRSFLNDLVSQWHFLSSIKYNTPWGALDLLENMKDIEELGLHIGVMIALVIWGTRVPNKQVHDQQTCCFTIQLHHDLFFTLQSNPLLSDQICDTELENLCNRIICNLYAKGISHHSRLTLGPEVCMN